MNKTVFSLLAIASVSVMFGQRPSPPPRHTPEEMQQRQMDHLATALTLTDAQKEKATALYKASQASTATMHASNKAAHDALKAAVQKNDTVSIDRASLQLGNLMAQEMSVRSKADAAFRQTLTADQQAKFDKMHQGGRGPGGPGGPGAFHGAPEARAGHRPPAPAVQ